MLRALSLRPLVFLKLPFCRSSWSAWPFQPKLKIKLNYSLATLICGHPFRSGSSGLSVQELHVLQIAALRRPSDNR